MKDEIIRSIRQDVYEGMELGRALTDEEVWELIDERIISLAKATMLGISERREIATAVFNSLRRLDVLQELVDDSSVSEIMINGPDEIFIERRGELCKWDRKFESKEKLEDIIQLIVGKNNRMVNEMNPIVDTRLENGSRVNIVLSPIAINGPIVTIRRFPDNPFTIEDLLSRGSINTEIADFLKGMVAAGMNIFVSGGTSSGKTTFLNVLANFIPENERVITIEDSAELCLKNIKNLVRLETRTRNSEGKAEITIRDLIKSALRMRPDRIIVGEVRSGEALDMINAMNTGHDGSLSTGHANSCKDMLKRLETMILMAVDMPVTAIRGQIAAGIDLMVHLGRARDGTRKLLEVQEIVDCIDGEIILNPLYRFAGKTGDGGNQWEKIGEIKNRTKLLQI